MIAVFYSIFKALFTGIWEAPELGAVTTILGTAWHDVTDYILNVIGGRYTALQSFPWQVATIDLLAVAMAVVAVIFVAVGVYRVTAMLFRIFFGGIR